MKQGQVFVRARDKNGKWYSADVLDLDEPSFRAFTIDRLFHAGIVTGIKPDAIDEPEIELQSTVAESETP